MDPILVIPIFFGGMALITGITMFACRPLFKAQERRRKEREDFAQRMREEKEKQKLAQENSTHELELKLKQAQAELQLERERNAMVTYCQYCGGKHAPTDKYCSNCGANLK